MYYLIFSIGTALACAYILYLPVLSKLKNKSINHLLVSYEKTGYLVIFACGFVATPVIFPILFNKELVEIFKSTLLDSLLS